jgi:hypothetical protein
MLTALVKEAESAELACEAWLATGHIADYRTWQTRLRHLEEADARYGVLLAWPREDRHRLKY